MIPLSTLLLPAVLASPQQDHTTTIPASWLGKWEFSECWKTINGDRSACIFYELELQHSSGHVSAVLSADGYMTTYTLKAEVKQVGNIFQIVFLQGDEGSLGLLLNPGDVMIELIRHKERVVTKWVSLYPTLKSKSKPGVHFQ